MSCCKYSERSHHKDGPQVAFVGMTKSNIGWHNSFARRFGFAGRSTEDGLAAVYASRSDGRAIHGHGGSRREQHHGSRRHENDASDSFRPRPPRSGLGPTS